MRRQYLVEGGVQGVGFRHFAWRQAVRLQLRGWVRNLPDGPVEAVADGPPDRLAQFEAELRRGPSMAKVTSVRSEEISDEVDDLTYFEIR